MSKLIQTIGVLREKVFTKKMYWLTSSVVSLLFGLAAFGTGVIFYMSSSSTYAFLAFWQPYIYMLAGLLIILGSLLVFMKKNIVLGGLLIMAPNFYVGPQSIMMFMPFTHEAFVIPLFLGWVLPIACFIFALRIREPHERAASVKKKE